MKCDSGIEKESQIRKGELEERLKIEEYFPKYSIDEMVDRKNFYGKKSRESGRR